jgi:methyl-accepting chemotaxis protein
MDRLRFAQKFALIGAVTFAVIAALLWQQVTAVSAALATTRMELLGVDYIKRLRVALAHLQQHRGQAARALGGDASARQALLVKRDEVNAALAGVDAFHAEHGDVLGTRRAFEAVKSDWERLRAEFAGLKPAESFARHSALVDYVLAHVRLAADGSLLTLDPEMETYYLMEVMALRAPELSEAAGQLRARATEIAATRRIEESDRGALTVYLGYLEKFAQATHTSLSRAYAALPALRGSADAHRKALEEGQAALGAELRGRLVAGVFDTPAAKVFEIATKPVEAALALFDTSAAALDGQLRARAARLEANRALNVALSILTLLGVAYLFAGMYLSLRRSLDHVIAVGELLAAGDLSARARITSRDEFAAVGQSFNRIGDGLRGVLERVCSSAEQLRGAATDLSCTSGQVSAATSQQSEAASKMAASVEQMTVSIGQVKDHSGEALKISREAGNLADAGSETVRLTIADMSNMARATSQLIETISNLERRSGEISKIVQVIQEIAAQTNLLALNAAIEAARAGEQGRGFSVVADEVRKLAERTAASTQEIGQMVAAIQAETATAVSGVQQWGGRVSEGARRAKGAGESMTRIHDGAARVVAAVNEITGALAEQSGASDQISRSVEKIAQMSEENAAAVGALAQAANGLEGLAETLAQAVAAFRLEANPG